MRGPGERQKDLSACGDERSCKGFKLKLGSNERAVEGGMEWRTVRFLLSRKRACHSSSGEPDDAEVGHQHCLPSTVPELCLCLENLPCPQSSASEDSLGCS